MKYVIKYTYDRIETGCECCTDYDSEIHVYEEHRVAEGVYTHQSETYSICDETELREYIGIMHPEYNNFELHPYSYFV